MNDRADSPPSPSQPDLIIHIGSRKTGTTALQRLFAINRPALEAQGLVYPGSAGDQHRLAMAILQGEGKPGWFHEELGQAGSEWQQALEEMEGKTGIVSSEFLFRTKPAEIATLREVTRDRQVRIVVYLRRQDLMIDSEYNQVVKGGQSPLRTKPFEDFLATYLRKKRDQYAPVIARWAEVFGPEAMVVRPYERSQFHGGSIFADFFHHGLGRELDDSLQLPTLDPNARLHRAVLEYKRLLNHLPLSEAENEALRKPLQIASQQMKELLPDYPQLSPAKAREVLEGCHASNCELAQRYPGVEGELLFTNPLPDPDAPWERYERLLPEHVAVIHRLLAEKHPEICGWILQKLDAAADHGLSDTEADLLRTGSGSAHHS